MCGICGFTGNGDQSILETMMEAMVYRGPDAAGSWNNEEGVHLGHRRLSIVDIADGHQPMLTEDASLVLVFNGEIYNHRELRQDLESQGAIFRTDHSDTEVLLHGYQKWGRSVVDRLNGMWAFALLDRSQGVLWLSRDRFGKKPLYYAQRHGEFYFSSELASLCRHPAIDHEIDTASLVSYFAHGYVPAPGSMISGVQKLPAGHNLIYSLTDHSTRLERYWRFEFAPQMNWVSRPQALSEALIEKLYAAVSTRMQADVPVGVFLSGGIDSSSVASLAMTASKSQNVKTYSIGFEDESFDETAYSSDMAAVLGTDHTNEQLTAAGCLELLDNIYTHLDEPMADSSLIPSFLMCRLARNQATVALGGDGADELFAGYDPFKALGPARLYSRFVPKSVHGAITNLTGKIPVSHRNMSLDFKLKKFLSGLGYESRIRNPVWLGTLPPGHLSRLFGNPMDPEIVYAEAIAAWEASGAENDIDRTLQFYMEMYLQNNILTKMDRAGMLNSLEVRSPFLDIDLVNLVRTIPAELKFDGRETKYILKKALAKVLPVEILYRRKKGFGIPIGQWFKEGSLSINPDALDGLVDIDFVKRIYTEHMNGQADWRSFLWAHFVLERWMQQPLFTSGS
jgi:asparagine synthase (glutamine-hydrolysing)